MRRFLKKFLVTFLTLTIATLLFSQVAFTDTEFLFPKGMYHVDSSAYSRVKENGLNIVQSFVNEKSVVKSLNVMDFGAIGDGVADDTKAIQSALNHSREMKMMVYVPAGKYNVKEIRISSGSKGIYGEGTLKGTSSDAEAVVTTNGSYFGGSGIEGILISINIDCNNTARRGIFLSSTKNSIIKNCRITRPRESGIRLHFGCINNFIEGNTILLPADEPYGKYKFLIGIQLVAESVDEFGGFKTKRTFIYQDITTLKNTITGNSVLGGTHGIAIHASNQNTIYSNTLRGQSHRGIILCPVASYNTVKDNKIIDSGSSGVHVAFGSNHNTISGNRVVSYATIKGLDRGAIQSYIGTKDNNFFDNYIDGNFLYGFYIGLGASGITIKSNVIKGVNSAIAIESSWPKLVPRGASYTRFRKGVEYKPINGIYDINIEDNRIIEPLSGFYIAQFSSYQISMVSIVENQILGKHRYALYIYEDDEGVNNLVLSGLVLDERTKDSYRLPRGLKHFSFISNDTIKGIDVR